MKSSICCSTLVSVLAAGALLSGVGMLRAAPVPPSPELPANLTARVAPPQLITERFVAEGPTEAVAIPLDGWRVVWPGQKPEDQNAAISGIAIAKTNVVVGGQTLPALRFTLTRGAYKTRPLIELDFPFNADVWNVMAFKGRVETSEGLQPLGFDVDMQRYGYEAAWHNGFYDNFGVSVYDGKFDWAAAAVPTTHFLYHVDRHDAGVDGFKDFQWDMRYEDHSCNKGFVRNRAKCLRFFYETRNLPTNATVVVTVAVPKLVKGAHIRFSEPERFAVWTNYVATYTPDLSDSSRYLGPPETGRLAKPIPLARNGKALAEIVCDFSDDILIDRWFPKKTQSVEMLKASGFERDVALLATRELKHWLDEITGANFPLYLQPSTNACPRIFLGAGFAKRYFAADLAELAKGQAGDGFAVREKDGDIYIFGACPAGTLYGVATFLENNTDIIWAMFDPLSTVYTRQPNLNAVWGDAIDKPVFVARGWGNSGGMWDCRNRVNYVGGPKNGKFGITGGHILCPQYYDHSEGVQRFNPVMNGKRVKNWSEWRTLACLTDPDFAAYTREWFSDTKFNDGKLYAYMDGLDDNHGVCTCTNCSAPIKTKDGRIITPKDYNEYYSAWIFRQFNNLAEHRDKEWPGYTSGSFCYFISAPFPPIEIHPAYKRPWLCTYVRKSRNVPVYAPINQHWWKLYKDWTGYSRECHLYDYYMLFGKIHPVAEVQQADLRAMRDLNFLRIHSESAGENAYLGGGDETWCINRLNWNPDADVEQLHRYYNRRTYREAAPWIDKLRGAIRVAWYRDYKADIEFENRDVADMIRDAGMEQELRGYLIEAYKAVRHPNSRYLIEKMAQSYKWYMGWAPIEGIPEPIPPAAPAQAAAAPAAAPDPEAVFARLRDNAASYANNFGAFARDLAATRAHLAKAKRPADWSALLNTLGDSAAIRGDSYTSPQKCLVTMEQYAVKLQARARDADTLAVLRSRLQSVPNNTLRLRVAELLNQSGVPYVETLEPWLDKMGDAGQAWESRAANVCADLMRAGNFTNALPWCRSRLTAAGMTEERRAAASADILFCLYRIGHREEAQAWIAADLERAQACSAETVGLYRLAFIRAAANAGATADTLALLRGHRADWPTGGDPLCGALPPLIAADSTLNDQRVTEIIRDLGQDDLSRALGWTSGRGRPIRASQVGGAAAAFAKRGDDAMGAALLTWQATAETIPLAMACPNYRKVVDFWENRARDYRAQTNAQANALAGLMKTAAPEADLTQARQALAKTVSALETADREGTKARKAWLDLLAVASAKATTRGQRGEAFETLMLAEWKGLEPDERIHRVDRLIGDAFLADGVRQRNTMRIPSLHVEGGQTNWSAISAHMLRAVKAGDWSGIPERRRNGLSENGDLRLIALSTVANQMVAAGEKALARDMLEKGVAILEYWADPDAVDLPKGRAEKLDKALEDVGGKRPVKPTR